MKVGIVVNIMGSDEGGQTSYRIAASCVNAGHDVWVMSSGNFSYDADNKIRVFAWNAPVRKYKSSEQYVKSLKGQQVQKKWITVDDLDVLLLRSNPSVQTGWAQHAGILFGQAAQHGGVIVLNDPNGLNNATNKMYLQGFPEEVRPRTLITRNRRKLKNFAKQEGTIVMKPLQGSGGKNVFIVRSNDLPNLNQIIRAVARDGYVIAQEYLPGAHEGDTRLFLMNGIPLQYKGKFAAFRRIHSGDDIRSNIHAGGKLRRARVDDTILNIAEMVRPKLVGDGMFLVGLDIVGNKLMEINVFSPGGLGSAQLFEKVDFSQAIVKALERKTHYVNYYRRNFNNVDMATL